MRLCIEVLEVVVEGVCKMSSSCVESTQLDIWSSRVDSVRLSIEVLKDVRAQKLPTHRFFLKL